MRTENFKRGVALILLVLALVFSMISVAPPAHSGAVIYDPGGTIIEVVQGDNFLIRHTLEWNEPENGMYQVIIAWDNPDNEPSENFTFLSASTYFTTGDYVGESIRADVVTDWAPWQDPPLYTVLVKCPIDNKDPRNGRFNVDITLGAYGAGGVPHIVTDNHPTPFQLAGIMIIEGTWLYPNRDPITIRVLPKLISVSPWYQENENGGTLTYTATVTNTDDATHTYTLDNDDNAGWGLNIQSTVGPLSPDASENVTLSVTIPEDAIGFTEDKITVTATALDNAAITDNAWCIAHVTVIRAVEVSIEPSENSARPEENATFTVTVKNTGNAEDNYGLTVGDNAGWGPTLDNDSLAVPAGENGTTTLRVTIPEDAMAYTEDNITVTATSEDESVENSASCIARAEPVPGVEVSIVPENKSGPINSDVTFQVTVKNTGNIEDNYDLENTDDVSPSWLLTLSGDNLVDNRRLENVAPGDNRILTLTVTIPENENLVCTWDNITVTATSQENTDVSDNATCMAHAALLEVEVSISPPEDNARPEENVTFTVTVKNTGGVEDNYDLTVSDNAMPDWDWTLENDNLTVPAGENRTTTLTVTIPDNALSSTRDNITVTATSQTDNAVSDNASCIAHAITLIRVEVSILPSEDLAPPGENIYYTVTVANTGNVEDNYTLTITENITENGWNPTLSGDNLVDDNRLENVPPFENIILTLSVTIHENAEICTRDNITITAVSQADNTVSDNASCIAHALAFAVEVSISPDNRSGLPGWTLTYEVTVKNVGSGSDNYSLEVTDERGWGTDLDNDLFENIAPDENETTTLRVTIPVEALPGTEDTITVTATSQTDDTVSDNASCIARSAIVDVEVSISPDNLDGLPGETLEYIVTVTNTGEAGDNYDLSVAESLVFYSTSSDGFISYFDAATYAEAHDNAGGEVRDSGVYNRITIGQEWDDIDSVYDVYRGFVFFDTSSIPEDATITSAVLSLYGYGDFSATDFDIVVQNGQPTYPHDPLESLDYDLSHYYDNNGGSFHTSNFTAGYNDITLNENGRGWIRKDNVTKLCLRSSRDIDDNTPTQYEWVYIYSSEKGENYKPKLTVTFSSWGPTLENDNLAVPAGENRTTTLRVTIHENATAYTEVNIIVTATSQADNAVSDSASCTAHAAPVEVEVSISPAYQYGLPGWTLTYEVMVKNVGLENGSYSLEVIDERNWGTDLDNDLFENIAPGDNRTTHLKVAIPVEALPGTEDEITVRAISVVYAEVIGSASCIAYPGAAAVGVSITPANQSGLPGATLTYTVTITNTGDITDNYALTVSDNAVPSWTLSLSDNRRENVSLNESRTVTLTITIPENATPVTEDNITVTATSQADNAVSDNASCIARSAIVDVEVSISPGNLNGLPGEPLEYTVTVTNTGEAEDNYALTVSDNAVPSWTLSLSNNIIENVPPSESGILTLSVTIHENATISTRDNITVTATSQGNTEVSDNASCVAHVGFLDLEFSILPEDQRGLPDGVLPYSVTIKNTGTVVENLEFVELTADNLDWILQSIPLGKTFSDVPPGEERSVAFFVKIPSDAAQGATNNITVKWKATHFIYRREVIYPSDDAYVLVYAPNEPHNKDELEMAYMSGLVRMSWLKFEVPPVAENFRANLWLNFYTYTGPDNEQAGTGAYFSENDNWSEETITWNNMPQFAQNFTDNIILGTGWKIWDLTPDVRRELGSDNKLSWLLKSLGTGSYTETCKARSKEYYVSEDQPYLDIIYEEESVATDNSTAYATRLKIFLWPISPGLSGGKPGDEVTFTITATNISLPGESDNYHLTVSDDAGWGLGLDDNRLLNVETGTYESTKLKVTIPEDAQAGMKDNLVVTITSEKDPNISENVGCSVLVSSFTRGVRASIEPRENTGAPDENVTFTVTVTNIGEGRDNFELTASDNENWGLTILPSTLVLAAGASENATLTVGIPDNAENSTRDNIHVLARSLIDNEVSAENSCIAHVIEVFRGVTVSIFPENQENIPGGTLEYTVMVTNTGIENDNYVLTVSDNENWSPRLSDNLLGVPAGENRQTTLSVTIPENAEHCTRNNITVTATSQADDTVYAEDSCIAHAVFVTALGVDVSISPNNQTGRPEENLTFTVTVKNTGENEDTYVLTISDDAGWGAELADNLLENVQPDENVTVTLSVVVPSDAIKGESTQITVNATSQADPTVENSASRTANAGEKAVPVPILPIAAGGAAIGGGIVTVLLWTKIIQLPSLRSRFLRSLKGKIDVIYIVLKINGMRKPRGGNKWFKGGLNVLKLLYC